MRPLLLAAALAATLPAAARPAPAVTCHCFRSRSFDPADPASSDPYVLATTRSSLLSAAFGVGKGELVRAVMGGTAPDDLWIAHWAGARARRPADALLEEKQAGRAWAEVLAGARGLGAPFERALAAGALDAALSAIAVDDVLGSRLGVPAEDLTLLRAAGARTEEVVLAAVLSVRLRTPAMPILARVRSGGASWSAVLHDAGLRPEDMDGVVRALVR